MKSFLRGFGFYLPARQVLNQDLETVVETSDEWIVTRTGIQSRYYAAPGQGASDLAFEASRAALEDAGLHAEDLTHILVATCTPDTLLPAAACYLQQSLGAGQIPAFDLNAACSGFLYGLESARAFTALFPDACVLVVGTEKLTSRLNFQDRSTCVLFGDGAGAAIVTGEKNGAQGCEVLDSLLHSDGRMVDLLQIRAGGSLHPLQLGQTITADSFISMQGREVFKYAVRCMAEVSLALLERNSLAVQDIDLFIPHQANTRIIHSVVRKLGVEEEKVYSNVQHYGNTSAASIPIALAEAVHTGHVQPGDKVLLSSFGAGFAWGAVLLQF